MTRQLTGAVAIGLALSLSACCLCGDVSPEDRERLRKEREAREKKEEARKRAKERAIRKKEKASAGKTDILIEVDVDRYKKRRRVKKSKHWDIAKGKPDPAVEIINKRTGRVVWTDTQRDALDANFRVRDLYVSPGDELIFKVVDKDAASHDEVGTYRVFYSEGDYKTAELDKGYIAVDFK